MVDGLSEGLPPIGASDIAREEIEETVGGAFAPHR
jgi:hypothetical protein